MTRTLLLAFALGFTASVLATLLVRAIAAGMVLASMGLELVAGLLGIWAWQLWAERRHDRRVLMVELYGSVLGTGLALRYGW
jgi:lambda repressor-like predicted transcriptional regulator